MFLKLNKNLFKSILFLSSLVFILGYTINTKASGFIYQKKPRVVFGINIENKSVKDFDKKAVDDLIVGHINDVSKNNLILNLKDTDKVAKISLSKLNLRLKDNDKLDKIFDYGNRGNILQKIYECKNLSNNNLNISLNLRTDKDSIADIVSRASKKLNVVAKNGSLIREGGKFVINEGVAGYELSKNQAIEDIFEFINEKWDNKGDADITLSSNIVKPKGTIDELSKVKDLIGSATTAYSSDYNRSMNLANGAKKINASIVYPGETFSVYDAVSPFNKENGYYEAGAYENGSVVKSYGGGICQVSSTLYNAALAAELEIVERSAHSMIVSYLPPSKDAAIAGTYKDLKFKNNKEYPIYIEGDAQNGKLFFNIYGFETRPKNRIVKYESEILSTTESPNKYIMVDKPIGYKNVVSSAHIGHTARLLKIVNENGKEIKTVVNNSTYRATPKIIEIGIKSDNQDDVNELKAAIKTKDKVLIDGMIQKLKASENENTEESDISNNENILKKPENKVSMKYNMKDNEETTDDDDWTDGSER